MNILLLDMDSVLLEPRGYYLALRETVRLIGSSLGYRGAALTMEDIEYFETTGVTSEWVMAAICTALMLDHVWDSGLNHELPEAPPLPKQAPHGLAYPDFAGFFAGLDHAGTSGSALEAAEAVLLDLSGRLSPGREERIRHILRTARRIEGSLTHRMFQELTLGSKTFADVYALEPYLHSPSYLLEYDESLLPHADRADLLAWHRSPHAAAVIFTNRPSRPPPEHFDTPEAELGARLVGLEALPIAGAGSMGWLAAHRGREYGAYLKPSPLHALTALRLALGDEVIAALQAAVALVEDARRVDGWERLHGATTLILEDSAKGMRSLGAAVEVLASHGIQVQPRYLGVTASAQKAALLEPIADELHADISEALRRVPEMG